MDCSDLSQENGTSMLSTKCWNCELVPADEQPDAPPADVDDVVDADAGADVGMDATDACADANAASAARAARERSAVGVGWGGGRRLTLRHAPPRCVRVPKKHR